MEEWAATFSQPIQIRIDQIAGWTKARRTSALPIDQGLTTIRLHRGV
jgi:hypothetical protein